MFDLEKAIRAWKKELAKKPALEETYIFELESALRDEVADLVRDGICEKEAFQQTSSDMGKSQEISKEFSKVRLSGRRGFLIGNYLRISLRKIFRQKGYSFINIASLAVGLASCILMMLWIKDDLSFDRFHANKNSLFRVIMETKTANTESLDARTPTPLGQALKDELPEVLDFSRYQGYIGGWTIKAGDKSFFDDTLGIGDPSFFTIFSFPFVKGDPATALVEPRSIVLTESMASKCFGDQDPMGKTIEVTSMLDEYLVTGVIRDIPENSHLRFDCMIPLINTVVYNHIDYDDWNEVFFYSYIQLAPQVSPDEAARKISGLIGQNTSRPNVSVRLQPLKDVHLRSNFEWDMDNYGQGSITTLSTFTIAAVVILLLACINFMNLSTARSSNRAKEVGLRKVTGAGRSDIIKQFLGESVVLSFISLFLALFLVYAALPLFNKLAGKQLMITHLIDVPILLVLFGITLLTGLVSGSYPALFLSAFRPAKVLKGDFLSGRRSQTTLRKSLVVVQFTLTLFLVMGTLVVDRQLRFIRNKNLGINTHQVITLTARARYETMKDAFLAHPNVLSMTRSLPPARDQRGISNLSWDGKNPDDIIQFYPVPVDADYLDTLGIEMAEGRFFSDDMPSDRTEAVIINETAAGIMGTDSPLGKRLTFGAQTSPLPAEERTLTVIGVVKDFHQSSLHRAIEPMFFTMEGDQWPYICVRISAENVEETLEFIGAAWKTVVPNYPFTYGFLDDEIDNFYKSERKIESILGLFTIIALFTACLGLLGLASFIAEKKTKEIGIRKIMGASVPGLILMQTRSFAAWVLLANVIAWPAAYFAIGKWLQGFSYHIRPGVELAALAAAFSLSVAILTVGYKALKAALACPAESLKYE